MQMVRGQKTILMFSSIRLEIFKTFRQLTACLHEQYDKLKHPRPARNHHTHTHRINKVKF